MIKLKDVVHGRYTVFFLKAIFSIGLIYMALHPFLILNFFKMSVSMNWVQGAYEKKEKAALMIREPKIIIAAGSSVHFGVKAQMIEEALQRPTINYGIMALLDLDYILYRLKKILKPQDIAILPLEYEHYTFNPSKTYSTQRVYYLLTFDQEFFHTSVPFLQKIRTFYRLHPLLFIGSFYEQLRARNAAFQSSGLYKLDDINQYGDETSNHPNMISASPTLIIPKPTQEALIALKEFQDWCQKRGVKFYLTFPNMAYFDIYDSLETTKDINRFIQILEQNNLKVMGHPKDAMVDKELVLDTGYHLTSKGIQIRTARLIELMKETLGLPLKKSIPLNKDF